MNIEYFLKAHKECFSELPGLLSGCSSLNYQRGCYRSSLNTFVMGRGNAIS